MHSGAPPGGGGCSRGTDMNDKALRMLKRMLTHRRRQITEQITEQQTPPEAAVRGAALSRGVDPQESECDALVEELRRGGYFETYPPSRPLAPRAVPTHRPGHRRSRGELNRPAPASLA
jgi:hypothetical protein